MHELSNYESVVRWLFSQLPMYQRIGQAAYKANLATSLALDTYFGAPHRQYKTIHVAGTNGKGSVSHLIAAVLQQAGYRVGLYTSPHLLDFRERIRINGKVIEKKAVVDFVQQNKSIIADLQPSFFEMTAALAFEYFAQQKVDVAVVETGMGGRLDSTNIITPILSVITNISLDHTAFLGQSLLEIAAEKAGIIKHRVPVVIGETQPETQPVFVEKAQQLQSEIVFADQLFQIPYVLYGADNKMIFSVTKNNEKYLEQLELDLLGQYQKKNLITVLTVLEQLKPLFKFEKSTVRKALQNVVRLTHLQGRWHVLGANPRIVADTAHNEAGLKEVLSQIQQTPYKKLHLVLGMVSDKSIDKMLALFPKDAVYYFTRAKIPRSLSEQVLEEQAQKVGLHGSAYGSVADAFAHAKIRAQAADFIFVGGSTFVVADLLEALKKDVV